MTLNQLLSILQRYSAAQNSVVPFEECIEILHARLNRVLRTLEQEVEATIVLDATGKGTLPAGFLESIYAEFDSQRLRLLPSAKDSELTAGTPRGFYFNAGVIQIVPYASGNLLLKYRQSVPIPTPTVSNWLLAQHPDVYLYGLLLEWSKLNQRPEAAASYAPMLEQALAEVQRHDARKRAQRGEVSPSEEGYTINSVVTRMGGYL